MNRTALRHVMPLAVLATTLIMSLSAAAQNPCNPCAKNPCNPCGKASNPCAKGATAPMPAMNPCAAKEGTVFYVNDPMNRDSVTFRSAAPLEDIVGTTTELAGYVVFDPAAPQKGIKGSFNVPVAALNTGIPLRDEHLRSEMWLDAENHPLITLTVKGVDGALTPQQSGGNYQTYKGTLLGDFGIKGKTQELRIPAAIVYMTESELTRSKLPGDLIAGRANFSVSLANFGITGPPDGDVVGTKVSQSVSVEVSFTGSTVMPEGGNPCNPCAKNPCNPCAKNPCNPCAKK